MLNSNDFILGLVIYEGLLVAALAGTLIYLLVAYHRFKDKTNLTISDLTYQYKDLYLRYSQVQAILTIMDSLGVTFASPSSKASLSKPEKFSKNPHRWDVISNEDKSKKELDSDSKKEP